MRLNAEALLYRMTRVADGHGGETRTWVQMPGRVYCRKWTPGQRDIVVLDMPDWIIATKRMEDIRRRDRLLFVDGTENPLMRDEDGNALCCELTSPGTVSMNAPYQIWGARERPFGNE